MNETREIKTSKVIFREDLYPRINKDPALVQRYAENLEVLPPIEVNQNNILIDGWHRWTAYRKKEAATIAVIITETKGELELFALSIQRNATHGLQLTEKDKSETAKRLYNTGTGLGKEQIAKTLSVTLQTVNTYLYEIDQQRKTERKKQIFELYLATYTDNEIGDKVGLSDEQVRNIRETQILKELSKSVKLLSTFQDEDFNPPLYTEGGAPCLN